MLHRTNPVGNVENMWSCDKKCCLRKKAKRDYVSLMALTGIFFANGNPAHRLW